MVSGFCRTVRRAQVRELALPNKRPDRHDRLAGAAARARRKRRLAEVIGRVAVLVPVLLLRVALAAAAGAGGCGGGGVPAPLKALLLVVLLRRRRGEAELRWLDFHPADLRVVKKEKRGCEFTESQARHRDNCR